MFVSFDLRIFRQKKISLIFTLPVVLCLDGAKDVCVKDNEDSFAKDKKTNKAKNQEKMPHRRFFLQ